MVQATVKWLSLMAKAGRHLGNLFQIRDDILGVWGDASVTGKAVGSDIMRKKKSLPCCPCA